jgi:hypothetical protein
MIKKLFTVLLIAVTISILLIFNYYIEIQNKLDMKELEKIVEKELLEKHGKN